MAVAHSAVDTTSEVWFTASRFQSLSAENYPPIYQAVGLLARVEIVKKTARDDTTKKQQRIRGSRNPYNMI